jgi:hypothetical protein
VRNLELKVRCPSEEALDALIARARSAGAVYVRTMGQRDAYFRVPYGRLKLREWWLDVLLLAMLRIVRDPPAQARGPQCRRTHSP